MSFSRSFALAWRTKATCFAGTRKNTPDLNMIKNMTENDKTELRAKARQQRLTLNTNELSKKIRNHIEQWSVFRNAKVVLSYNSLPGEIDLSPLIAKHSDKEWYLPRTLPNSNLEFHAFKHGDSLKAGPFGINEPLASASLLESSKQIDLIFVPALMLDQAGNRLGFGKGYYDRFLAKYHEKSATVCPIPSGLIVKTLPKDLWDIPMKWAATETAITRLPE